MAGRWHATLTDAPEGGKTDATIHNPDFAAKARA